MRDPVSLTPKGAAMVQRFEPIASSTPEKNRMATRMLVVAYRLTKGRTDVEIERSVLIAECRRECVEDLTDAQFRAYHERVIAEVKAGLS